MTDSFVAQGEKARKAHLELWPKAKTKILLAQGLEEQLALSGPASTALSCRLPWSFAKDDKAGEAAHAKACPSRPPPLSNATLAALLALSEGKATGEALPEPPAWSDVGRWACLDGSPYAFIEADPWRHSILFWPAVDTTQLRGLVRLHLFHAEQKKTVNVAVLEQLQLARALLGCEVMSAQLAAVDLLKAQREWLDRRGGAVTGLPDTEEIELLRAARFAGSQALHPWLVDGESDEVQQSLPPAVRCAAVLESSMWALYVPMLEQRHAKYLGRMRDEALLKAWCEHPRAAGQWLAAKHVPDDVWERIDEGLQLKDNWPMRLARVSERGKAAVGELLLAIATPKPVRE